MTGSDGKKIQRGSASFKYYIHDTAEGYSLQMLGPLKQTSLSELACCWATAKTTLKDRTLTLDITGVTGLDEPSHQWLASMAMEGAKCIPESFLRNIVAGLPDLDRQVVRQNVFCRLSSVLRSCHQTKTVNADSVRVTGR